MKIQYTVLIGIFLVLCSCIHQKVIPTPIQPAPVPTVYQTNVVVITPKVDPVIPFIIPPINEEPVYPIVVINPPKPIPAPVPRPVVHKSDGADDLCEFFVGVLFICITLVVLILADKFHKRGLDN